MKRILALILALVCAMALMTAAAAEGTNWPNDKTIQMIIPFGAGGDTDLHCRVLTDLVSKELGVDIVCTNVTGTSGTVAARQVKDSEPDGYTVLWHQTSFLMASLLGVSEFDFHDFETASTVIEDMSSFLCVNANNGKFTNFDEFVQYGKDHPGELLCGVSIGGDAHMYTLMMADKLGLDVTYVDLDGTNEIIPALLNNDIDFTLGIYGTYGEYVRNGDFAALAYMGETALDGSDTPTWKEITGEDFPIGKMFGYWFPAGTPQEIVDAFNAAVEKAVNSEEFKAHCAQYFITPVYRSGADAVAYLDNQYGMMQNYKDALLVK